MTTYLKGTDGNIYEFPDDKAQAAANAGFVTPTEQELALKFAGDQPLKTFGERTLGTVTFGASDYFATPEERTAMNLRREANPKAAFAGEVVGGLPLMAVPVAAPLKGASLAARAGNFAIQEGVRNGLLGMGSSISEQSLQNQELTAERTLMSGIAAAGVGIVAGGALNGAGKAADKLLQKGAEFMPGALDRLGWATTYGARKLETAGLGAMEVPAAIGAVYSGGLAGGAAFVAGRGALKMFGPKAGEIAGAALRKAARSEVWQSAAEAFKNQVLERASMGLVASAARTALVEAAAQGTDEFLAEHSRQAQADPNYLPSLAMAAETPEEAKSAGKRLATLETAAQAAKAQAEEHHAAVEGFFSSRTASVPTKKRKFEDIKAFAESDPALFFDAMYNSDMPTVSSMQASIIAKAALMLKAMTPQDPGELAPPALKRPWNPSAADIAKLNRHLDALEMPNQILKSGNILPEHVQVWQSVYPKWFAETKMKMVEALSAWDKKKPLPYAKKMALQAILGPVVLGMSPQQLMTIQAVHKDVAPPANPKGPDGRQEVDQEDNMETQGQRMEAR